MAAGLKREKQDSKKPLQREKLFSTRNSSFSRKMILVRITALIIQVLVLSSREIKLVFFFLIVGSKMFY